MRIQAVVLALGVTVAGAAEASSLLVVAPPAEKLSVSLTAVGTPQTAPAEGNASIQISPSMMAKGEPAVEDENVSSIDAEQPQKSTLAAARPPMVIRGGMVGDAFAGARPATTAQAQAEPLQPQKASEPKPQSASQPAAAAQPKAAVRQPE